MYKKPFTEKWYMPTVWFVWFHCLNCWRPTNWIEWKLKLPKLVCPHCDIELSERQKEWALQKAKKDRDRLREKRPLTFRAVQWMYGWLPMPQHFRELRVRSPELPSGKKIKFPADLGPVDYSLFGGEYRQTLVPEPPNATLILAAMERAIDANHEDDPVEYYINQMRERFPEVARTYTIGANGYALRNEPKKAIALVEEGLACAHTTAELYSLLGKLTWAPKTLKGLDAFTRSAVIQARSGIYNAPVALCFFMMLNAYFFHRPPWDESLFEYKYHLARAVNIRDGFISPKREVDDVKRVIDRDKVLRETLWQQLRQLEYLMVTRDQRSLWLLEYSLPDTAAGLYLLRRAFFRNLEHDWEKTTISLNLTVRLF